MKVFAAAALITFFATTSLAQECGGSFDRFVKGLETEGVSKGYPDYLVSDFFSGVQQDQSVLKADRSQGFFQKPFTEFSGRLISQNRIAHAEKNYEKYIDVFAEIENDYGIGPGVLLAFWAFETDFGAVQGDTNTLNALVTLAHDCRRPELFRPQVFAALELYERTSFHPMYTTGAWAGEIGQVQMLPGDIIKYGVDGDGSGTIDLKGSAEDALLSGANMLSHMGWRHGEPWIQEVEVPGKLDWSKTGTETSLPVSEWVHMGIRARDGQLRKDLNGKLILPEGRKGPAFIAYPNFDVFTEWNQSLTYILTAAYFARHLEGAPAFTTGTPDPALTKQEVIELQTRLEGLGHDVGGADGIIGAKTRKAIQSEQKRLGLPADAWPTLELLNKL